MIELQSVWGWEPALYLFLGGLGAGTFVVSAIIYLLEKVHRKACAVGMWTAAACLCVGLGLLLMDVEKPFSALLMWRSFGNVGASWMAIGAWILFAAVIVFVLCAIMLTDRISGKIAVEKRKMWANILAGIGIVLGLGVAAYTGILLKSAPGVPFWNTGILPLLFTVSAMDTGVALVAIIFAIMEPATAKVTRRNLEICAVVLILVETAVLIWFLKTMQAGGPLGAWDTMNAGYAATAVAGVGTLLQGKLSFAFWALVVVLGLAVPFLVAIFEIATAKGENAKGGRLVAIIGSACALVGGCALRFVVLLAGAHADIVVDTIANLL